MYIVTVALKGTLGAFPDGEGFLVLDDAVARAEEWAAVTNVTEVTVTTAYHYMEKMAEDTGLLVGLGKALGYDIELENEAAAA